MTADALLVRPLGPDDYERWATMFRSYRDFYRLEPDDAVVSRVWSWIHDPAHETCALGAAFGDKLVGLAHYRRFARPSSGGVGIFLDDLFTDPVHRGRGAGRALIGALGEIAEQEQCNVVRWITAADNITAQRLYDSIATRTAWLTYDLPHA